MKHWFHSSIEPIARLAVQCGIGFAIAFAVYLIAEGLCRSTRAKRRAE